MTRDASPYIVDQSQLATLANKQTTSQASIPKDSMVIGKDMKIRNINKYKNVRHLIETLQVSKSQRGQG